MSCFRWKVIFSFNEFRYVKKLWNCEILKMQMKCFSERYKIGMRSKWKHNVRNVSFNLNSKVVNKTPFQKHPKFPLMHLNVYCVKIPEFLCFDPDFIEEYSATRQHNFPFYCLTFGLVQMQRSSRLYVCVCASTSQNFHQIDFECLIYAFVGNFRAIHSKYLPWNDSIFQ